MLGTLELHALAMELSGGVTTNFTLVDVECGIFVR